MAQFAKQKFYEGAVRSVDRHVHGGGDADSRFPAVGHDDSSAIFCQLANPARFGEPANASDVGLRNVGLAAIHQVDEFKPAGLPLPGGDKDVTDYVGNFHTLMESPPSATRVAPVMYAHRSPLRNPMTLAISAGSPMRPRGMFLSFKYR